MRPFFPFSAILKRLGDLPIRFALGHALIALAASVGFAAGASAGVLRFGGVIDTSPELLQDWIPPGASFSGALHLDPMAVDQFPSAQVGWYSGGRLNLTVAGRTYESSLTPPWLSLIDSAPELGWMADRFSAGGALTGTYAEPYRRVDARVDILDWTGALLTGTSPPVRDLDLGTSWSQDFYLGFLDVLVPSTEPLGPPLIQSVHGTLNFVSVANNASEPGTAALVILSLSLVVWRSPSSKRR